MHRLKTSTRSDARRIVCGLLLVVWIVSPLAAAAASASPHPAELSDAERVAMMRDRAAQADRSERRDRSEPASKGDILEAAEKPETGTAEESAKTLPPNESLLLGGQDADASNGLGFFGNRSEDGQAASGNDGWLMNTLMALGVVIALVFLIRFFLRKGGVVSTAAPQGGVVEVLSRTTVAPRSHVVLMRVGQRILVVSDSTAGMRTLASVAEPEEVAELLGAVTAAQASSVSQSFNGVMKKLSGQWSADDRDDVEGVSIDDAMDDGVGMDRARGALSSVRSRLNMLAKAGGGT